MVTTYLDFYYLEEGNESEANIQHYVLSKVKEVVYTTALVTTDKDSALKATKFVSDAIIE